MFIDLIAGARPNFMKIAPIIKVMNREWAGRNVFGYRLVHTGQHYDHNMSEQFFQQLGIPNPDINLEVGSGTQAEQTAGIMIGYEKVLLQKKSDLCIVVGDVTSTLACAITAQKLHVPVAHVEGGIRSGDWTMPEEINRMATDAVSNWFFTTSKFANQHLLKSGVKPDRIFFVGNTMIDTLLANLDHLRPPDFWDKLHLRQGNYFVVTMHRPSNVDSLERLNALLRTIGTNVNGLPVIFPVHPRTAKNFKELDDQSPNIHFVDPQGYFEFIYLVKHSKGVITDSGGITEETTVMGIPCLSMRENTERPETISIGTNELVGNEPNRIARALQKIISGKWKKGTIPERWDGKAAERIVKHLEEISGQIKKNQLFEENEGKV